MHRVLVLALVTFILHFQPSSASWNAPLVGRHVVMPQRRQDCGEGNGVSNQDQIISEACNANPQNDYWTCYNQLVLYIRQSAANTCSMRYTAYNGCLVNNKSNATACADAKAAWDGCSNYAVDIYKYCSCWYTMPADLYDCANVILEIRPRALDLSTIPTTVLLSTALLTGPVLPASASATSSGVAISVVTLEPQPLQTTGGTQYIAVSTFSSYSPAPYYSYYSLPIASAPIQPPLIASAPIQPPLIATAPIQPPLIATAPIQPLLIATPILQPLPVISSEAVSTSKTTTTIYSQTTRTVIATITLCAPTITNCPRDYSSYSLYASTIHQTIYSCDGGCDKAVPPPQTVCVQRKRIRMVRRGEL